jgi:hypothetical protein
MAAGQAGRRSAAIQRQGTIWPNHSNAGLAARQSEFDKLSAALDRAEFALRELRKKSDELHRRRAAAKTMEEIAALNLDADELLQDLRKISVAVHTGHPAPHLRLVPKQNKDRSWKDTNHLR